MEIEKKLNQMGFELPDPPVPAANYISFVRVDNLLFVGGNIGRINGTLKYRGKVGDAVTLEQAYEAARNCALNHLATVKAALGDFGRVERIVKVLGYVNVARDLRICPSRQWRVRLARLSLGRKRPAYPRSGGCSIVESGCAGGDRSHRADPRIEFLRSG